MSTYHRPAGAAGRFALAVHGGTVTSPEGFDTAQLALIDRVVAAGRAALEAGAAALEVVVDCVVALEDSGLLDAGKGSYLNTQGFVENDAALMEGHTGRAGGVAAVQRLKNPIAAARLVMERTPHVLLVGVTGEQTLLGLGAESVDDPSSYFIPYVDPGARRGREGTVGAVALDAAGHLAAATSTGGTPGKVPGRVGDSPLIGAGTYADEHYAVSATGIGEHFIRRCAAVDIAHRAEYRHDGLCTAAEHVILRLIGEIDRAAGAVIAMSHQGEIVVCSNVYGVLHGCATDHAPSIVGVTLG